MWLEMEQAPRFWNNLSTLLTLEIADLALRNLLQAPSRYLVIR